MKIIVFAVIVAFVLSGCGVLKEIYRIDKIKQENCNPCEHQKR